MDLDTANGAPNSPIGSNPLRRARATPARISAAVPTKPAWSVITNGVSSRLCTKPIATPLSGMAQPSEPPRPTWPKPGSTPGIGKP